MHKLSTVLIQEKIIVKGFSFFLNWWSCVLVLIPSNFQLNFLTVQWTVKMTVSFVKIILTSKSGSHCRILVLYMEKLLIPQGPHFGTVIIPHSSFLFAVPPREKNASEIHMLLDILI